MSIDDDQMTAAPRPLVFTDGTEYRFAPLTDGDLVELDHWVRSQYIKTVMRSLDPTTSIEYATEVRCAAAERAMRLTWTSGLGAAQIQTVDGMARLVWQCCFRQHPNLTFEEVRKKLFTPGNLAEAARVFGETHPPIVRNKGAQQENPQMGRNRPQEPRNGVPENGGGKLSRRERKRRAAQRQSALGPRYTGT